MVSYKDYIQKGEYIILEMTCGDVFEGDVINVGENLLEMINVRQHNNQNNFQGLYTFYRVEIERIFKLKTQVCKPENVNPKLFRISCLDKKEYDRLKHMSQNFIYLENADSRYYKAVEDLENAETIGVAPLDLDKSIATEVTLLVMSTFEQVYLFDLTNLKDRAFYPELKAIFESNFICKVLHGGIAFIDILYKNYKVYASNIFDTQVTDLVIEKRNCGGQPPKITKSLAHCLKVYLNLPPSILKIPQKHTKKNWSVRPLSDMDKLYASQLCTYLIKLQNMMKRKLLSGVYETINSFHHYVYKLSDNDFEEYVNSNKISEELHEIIPFLKEVTVGKNFTSVSDKPTGDSELTAKTC